VIYASGADLQSMNGLVTVHPFAKQVQRYVLLTTLVRYDSTLTPTPYLARRWRWSTDRRTLTFTLHTDVRWQDGVATTSRDVVWTLNAARAPATGYARWSDVAGITAVEAQDDSTVAIHFTRAPAGVPDVLTDLAILPAHLLDTVPLTALRRAAWNDHPIGNGPFRFVSHEPNRRWVFAANPDFPPELGGPPRLARFVVVVVDEPTAKLAALVGGDVDFAGITAAHAAFVRRDSRFAVLDYALIFPYALVFNTRHPPFDDRRVRLALALAIDREAMVNGYAFGFATPAAGPVESGVPGYVSVPEIPYNPDSARHLLAGRCPEFEILTVGSGEAALEQMIQANLATVGCDVRIRQLDLSAFLGSVYGPGHDFSAAVMGIPGDVGLGYLRPLGDLTGMTVPGDPAAAQGMFSREEPIVWLYHARGVNGMNRRVHGVRMDIRGELVTVARWWTAP
jgi:peptide/nickel transport system substrate-binding protein